MTEAELYRIVLYSWFGLGAVTFLSLLFITAPYGRHGRSGFGPQVSPRMGWVLMEAPASIGVLVCVAAGPRSSLSWLFCAIWQAHYAYRAFIFPFRLKSDKKMPLVVALSGALFNIGNAYLIGRSLSAFGHYDPTWLSDPRFIAGLALYFVGFATHVVSDEILMNLRKPGETGYKIPTGFLYRWVSSPNYLGELIEWCGWALLTWSPAGLAFALFTLANLLPRALQHHRWYREKFPDYPQSRRALIPYLL